MGKYEDLAQKMCEQIAVNAMIAQSYYNKAFVSSDVLKVMKQIPRHKFVQAHSIEDAYLDRPLYIGHEQTISQPYIVALMTSLIQPKSTDRVLDIGTGSGYQTAILAKMVHTVYTVELVPDLLQSAIDRFKQLQITNIVYSNKNGVNGWVDYAPFDSILVAAAAKEIPLALIEQLTPGGRMVIPIEDQLGDQQLYLVQKNENLSLIKQPILPVRFVPFKNA